MEIMDFVNVMDILLIAVFAYSAISGAINGFVKSFLGFLKYIVCFILSKMFYKSVSSYLMYSSVLYKAINGKITEVISGIADAEVSVESFINNLNLEFVPNGMVKYLENLIHQSQNSLMGFTHHFSQQMSLLILDIISFVVLFILLLIAYKIVIGILDKIMDLPILSAVNGLGGFAVGMIKGLFFCVLFSTACYGLSMLGIAPIASALNASMLAKYFYIGAVLSI